MDPPPRSNSWRGQRSAALVLFALVLVLELVVSALWSPTARATDRPFAQRFAVTTPGDVTSAGNTLLSCDASVSACATGLADTSITGADDNDFDMQRVDIDADPATYDSSSAALSIPVGSTVLFAGLYYGADYLGAGNAGDVDAPGYDSATLLDPAIATVKLATPAGGGYHDLTASDIDTATLAYPRYQGFVNVTALVAAAGSGTYTVANVETGTGSDDYAGWGLVVAYSNPVSALRNLTVYDGFTTVSGTAVTLSASGFVTPPTGPVKAEATALAYETDAGFSGDTLSLGTHVLGDGANPSTDFFNGTIARDGQHVTTKSPNFRNQLGIDLDQVNADGLLANGSTSATLTATTVGDVYHPGMLALAIEVYAPRIAAHLTVTDVGSGVTGPPAAVVAAPGDTLRYSLTAANSGADLADAVHVAAALPAGVTLVPGSLAAADLGTITAGTGSATATFLATVDAGDTEGQTLGAAAVVSYVAHTAGTALQATSNSANVTVHVRHVDLAIALSHNETPVRGATETFRLSVTNGSADASSGTITVADTFPTGIVPTAASGTGWICTVAGQTVTCRREAVLGAHAGAPDISVSASVLADAPGSWRDTATVSNHGDVNRANDGASDGGTIAGDGDAGVTISATPSQTVVGNPAAYTTTVTDYGPESAYGVVLTITLGAPVTHVSITTSSGACTNSQPFRCTFSSLMTGQTATVTVTATPTKLGAVTATATITAASGDIDPSNDSATANPVQIAVPPTVFLRVGQTPDDIHVTRGQAVHYVLRFQAHGSKAATAVTVCSTIPRHTTLVSMADRGRRIGASVCWSRPSIAQTSKRFTLFHMTLRIAPTAPFATVRTDVSAKASNAVWIHGYRVIRVVGARFLGA